MNRVRLLSLSLMVVVFASCRTAPPPPPQVIVVPRLSPETGGCQGFGHDVCCDEDSMKQLVTYAQAGQAALAAQLSAPAPDGGPTK